MNFIKRLTNKLSELTDNTKASKPFSEELLDEDIGPAVWFVFRCKEGKWTKFGKGYAKNYLAFNAMVDWQALFPQVEFKVGKEEPHACSKCH